MKCRLTDKKKLTALLAASAVMIALGALGAWMLPEHMHLASRFAGFLSGAGTSLAVLAGVMLLRRARLGEARAKDWELTMNDERGLAVAYKAQNVAAVAAVLALAAMTVAAVIRDDEFYMFLGAFLLCAVALVKLVVWHIYNRKM